MRTTDTKAQATMHTYDASDSGWPLVLGFVGYAILLAASLALLAIYCSFVI